MKKVLMYATILASTAMAAKAQTGSILVGGNVDISSTNTPTSPETKRNTVSFNPTVGYQFNNNWTVGITGGISSDKTSQGNAEFKTTGINAGPFIRYTKPLSNLFSVYGQLQAAFGSEKNTNTVGPVSTTSKSSNTNINLFPAVFINLKNSFGLNFNIGGISYGSTKPSGGSNTNTFDLNFGKVASIGISKNFGGK